MSKHDPENQPVSPERRLLLRTAAAMGATALLWGISGERTGNDTMLVASKNDPTSVSAAASQVAEQSREGMPSAPSTPTEATEMPPVKGGIIAAEPQELVIPVLKFKHDISGAIHPVPVPYRGNSVYYDPPTNDGIYYAEGSALPSSPSEGTSYFFGHSDVNHIVNGAVFDQLPNLAQRDRIEVVTSLGRFAYEVTKNLTLPYDDLSKHTRSGDFGDGSVKDRLVLVTCRVPDTNVNVTGYNTVITANQIDAIPL